MSITEVTGDLFAKVPADCSLAHCISADCSLGRGIAKQFRDRFGRIQEIKDQNAGVGAVAVIPRTPLQPLRPAIPQQQAPTADTAANVYNLVTKLRFWHKPTHSTLRRALVAMAAHMRARGITNVAMPRIGCGLDRLEWRAVRQIIDDELVAAAGLHVTVVSPPLV